MGEGGGVQVYRDKGVERGGVGVEIGAQGCPCCLVAGGCERDGGWREGVGGLGGGGAWVRMKRLGVFVWRWGVIHGTGDVGVERCGQRAQTVFEVQLQGGGGPVFEEAA